MTSLSLSSTSTKREETAWLNVLSLRKKLELQRRRPGSRKEGSVALLAFAVPGFSCKTTRKLKFLRAAVKDPRDEKALFCTS